MARVLGVVGKIEVSQAAGVLAALSPMNDWISNVNDAFSLARNRESVVRTTRINREKALRILDGEKADVVLRGRKVRSFWAGISDPYSSTLVAVDRHLYRAAVGEGMRARDAAPSRKEYDEIEESFGFVGREVGESVVGVASTIWIVMRRVSNPVQQGLEFDEPREERLV